MDLNFGFWGDLASIAGLAVSVVGFKFTLDGIKKTKEAAEAAQAAAEAARSRMLLLDAISQISEVIASLDGISRMHLSGAWPALPEHYERARQSLVAFRATKPNLSKNSAKALQFATQTLASIKGDVERYLVAKPPAQDALAQDGAKLNESVVKIKDGLTAVVVELKSTGDNNG